MIRSFAWAIAGPCRHIFKHAYICTCPQAHISVIIYGRKLALTYYSAVRKVTVIISILMFGKQRPQEKAAAGKGLTVTVMQLVAVPSVDS